MSVDLLCIAGFDGYLKRVNPPGSGRFGYTEQELLSRPFIELVHPEDRAHTVAAALTVLAEGRELSSSRTATSAATAPRAGSMDVAARSRPGPDLRRRA